MLKTMLRALVVILTTLLSSSDASVNYCGAAMCGKTDAHTFCQFAAGPGLTCSGYVDDRLSDEEKSRLVARLNHRRSEVAQGRLEHLPPASNMLKLRWVEELAREAQVWADQCRPPSYPEEHDVCRDLYAITVGQCIASVVGEAPGLRPESMVDMWYMQSRQYQVTGTRDSRKPTEDFEQMIWAHTYLVGCARTRFMTEIDGRLRTVTRLVCNFAPRGPIDALWTPGAPAAACPPRAQPDADLPGLCTFQHDAAFTYDVTNETVLKEQSVLDTIMEIERNDSLNYPGSLDRIYLTKIMIVSMKNEAAIESYSTEKRDIVEPIFPANKSHLENITDYNKKNIDEVIAKKLSETSTARTFKKAISIVGRPKTYNIEELSLDKDFENGTARPVETVKEDDAYKDYGFDDILEINELDYNMSITDGNVTAASETVFESFGIENATEIITASKKSTKTMIPTVYSEISNFILNMNIKDETTTPYIQNDMLKKLIELSEKTEQNPSEPETARQLQEALEQMERALASPVSTKVRRELRSQQDTRNDDENPRSTVPQEKSQRQQLKEIGTPDAAPIMNILAKYAPFLEKYDSMFSRSVASNMTRSLVLLVLGWIVSSVL